MIGESACCSARDSMKNLKKKKPPYNIIYKLYLGILYSGIGSPQSIKVGPEVGV